MSSMTKTDGINAAMGLAEEIAAGTVDPSALEAELASECRNLFGQVVGDGDPLWPLQVDVARQVLSAGGISHTEVSEWAAVLRRRAGAEAVGVAEAFAEPSGDDSPSDAGTHASGDPGPDSDDPGIEPESRNRL